MDTVLLLQKEIMCMCDSSLYMVDQSGKKCRVSSSAR